MSLLVLLDGKMVLLEESTVLSGYVSNITTLSPPSPSQEAEVLWKESRRENFIPRTCAGAKGPQHQQLLLFTHFETIPGEQKQQELGMWQEQRGEELKDTSERSQCFQ